MAVVMALTIVTFTVLLGVPVTSRHAAFAMPSDFLLKVSPKPSTLDPHGGVKMGVSNSKCDNAKWRLFVDWDTSNTFQSTCQPDEKAKSGFKIKSVVECIRKDEIPLPLHKCMTEAIFYKEHPPRAGPHRPLWPVYGEYVYAPPQRWIHSLEHGGVVFLYHPCADPSQIELLKEIGKSCLRRHIITPYRNMQPNQNFAVLTYGCWLLMDFVDPRTVIEYVKNYALKGPEHSAREGQYDLGLIHKAAIVSDFEDSSVLCPRPPSSFGAGVQKNMESKSEDLDVLEKFLEKQVQM